MKIQKEKRNRASFIGAKVDQIVAQMIKSVSYGEVEKVERKKSARTICTESGRARGIIKGYKLSRYIYRRRADRGEMEGVRRGT